MRIARLAAENPRTQGPERRAWYRKQARNICAASRRSWTKASVHASPNTAQDGRAWRWRLHGIAVGAAGTRVAVRPAGRRGRAGHGASARRVARPAIRSRLDLLQADLSGGVSDTLAADLTMQPWNDLAQLGARAPLDAAASCIERCPVPDPPRIPQLTPGGYDLVLSTLVLTQLFSLPLLDVVDSLAYHAAGIVDLRETYPRYHEAAQQFRRRIVLAHLALMESLLAPDGVALLMSDETGYLLPPVSGPHMRDPKESLPLLPQEVLDLPGDLEQRFEAVGSPRTWEWLVSAPSATTPGRMYDVFGVVLRAREAVIGE